LGELSDGPLHAPLLALSRWAEEQIAEVLAARETYDAHLR
jgi:hypothetical protein